MRNMKIVAIGDLVLDMITIVQKFPIEPSKHQLIEKLELEPGGMGNFLIAGSRLGMDMIALDIIGDDLFSQGLKKILEAEKINTTNIIINPNLSAKFVIALTDKIGNHVFLSRLSNETYSQSITPGWIKEIESSDGIMIVGYSFLEEHFIDILLQAVKVAKKRGKPVFFDPGPLCNKISEDILFEVISNTEVILLTEEELELINKYKKFSNSRKLFDLGIKTICIKLGEQGCRILTGNEDITCPGYAVKVLDTNGAGDSFAAAFVHGYLSGWNINEIGRFSNLMGASKVKKIGSGRNVPTVEELRLEMVNQNLNLQFFNQKHL